MAYAFVFRMPHVLLPLYYGARTHMHARIALFPRTVKSECDSLSEQLVLTKVGTSFLQYRLYMCPTPGVE